MPDVEAIERRCDERLDAMRERLAPSAGRSAPRKRRILPIAVELRQTRARSESESGEGGSAGHTVAPEPAARAERRTPSAGPECAAEVTRLTEHLRAAHQETETARREIEDVRAKLQDEEVEWRRQFQRADRLQAEVDAARAQWGSWRSRALDLRAQLVECLDQMEAQANASSRVAHLASRIARDDCSFEGEGPA